MTANIIEQSDKEAMGNQMVYLFIYIIPIVLTTLGVE